MKRPERLLWTAAIWLLGVMPAVSGIANPRFFAADYVAALAASGGVGALAARVMNLAILALGGLLVVGGLVAGRGRVPRRGTLLWLGALALGAGPLLSARLGSVPAWSSSTLALPLVATGLFCLPPVPVGWLAREARRMLLLYGYGSLAAAAVAFPWAVEYPYPGGLVSLLPLRLHGIAPHANLLGPLMLTYLLLDWVPESGLRWERLHRGVVLICFVLAQSKTSWLVFAAAWVVRWACQGTKLGTWLRSMVLVGAGAGLAAAFWYLGGIDEAGPLGSLTTLTGRTDLWSFTLGVWARNPWFGYGPRLFDLDMRLEYFSLFGWAAPHAHNQLVQTLGEAGVVGAVGLLLFLAVLVGYGFRSRSATGQVSLLLVLSLLLRSVTEVPFREVLTDGNFLIDVLTAGLLLVASRRAVAERRVVFDVRPDHLGNHADVQPGSLSA